MSLGSIVTLPINFLLFGEMIYPSTSSAESFGTIMSASDISSNFAASHLRSPAVNDSHWMKLHKFFIDTVPILLFFIQRQI